MSNFCTKGFLSKYSSLLRLRDYIYKNIVGEGWETWYKCMHWWAYEPSKDPDTKWPRGGYLPFGNTVIVFHFFFPPNVQLKSSTFYLINISVVYKLIKKNIFPGHQHFAPWSFWVWELWWNVPKGFQPLSDPSFF